MEKQATEALIDEKLVPIKGKKTAMMKQRSTLYEMLSADAEYQDMENHIIVGNDLEETIDDDVRRETKLSNMNNVMKLLFLDIQGYGARNVAREMGLTEYEVAQVRKSVAYRDAKATVMAEILNMSKNIMEVSAIKAVKTLTECMSSSNEKVKLAASVEVLNRVGLNTPQKVELTTTNMNLMKISDEDLAEILKNSNVITGEVNGEG